MSCRHESWPQPGTFPLRWQRTPNPQHWTQDFNDISNATSNMNVLHIFFGLTIYTKYLLDYTVYDVSSNILSVMSVKFTTALWLLTEKKSSTMQQWCMQSQHIADLIRTISSILHPEISFENGCYNIQVRWWRCVRGWRWVRWWRWVRGWRWVRWVRPPSVMSGFVTCVSGCPGRGWRSVWMCWAHTQLSWWCTDLGHGL